MKMNQLKKKMIPLAMAMALVATGFAGNLAVQKTAYAEETPKTLIIKKVLTMPSEGVATPAETFEFKFEAHSFNGNTNNPTQTCPAIPANSGKIETKYLAADTTDSDTNTPGKQVVKTTDDVLAGVTWSKAGQYVYKVKEVEPTTKTAGMTYSKAEYTVSIFVEGTKDGKFKVKSIMIKQSKKEDGTNDTGTTKTEYTPGDPSGNGNNFAFENKYFPTGGNDNPTTSDSENDKKGLLVKKDVTGDNASDTQLFDFKIKIEKPAGADDKVTTYKYKVTNDDGKDMSEEKTGTYGNEEIFKLAKGHKLVLTEVLLGAKATVTETDSAGYTAKYKVTANGKADSNEITGTEASALLGDANGGNSIEFTNTQQTPTGVIIDNLPFIILVAIAGMGIFFFVRNKRRAEEF